MSYEETEKSWDGDVNIWLSRTGSIEIHTEEGKFRVGLVPLFTFMKQKLKDVDWGHISRTRDKKLGYKRLEAEELFYMLSSNLT